MLPPRVTADHADRIYHCVGAGSAAERCLLPEYGGGDYVWLGLRDSTDIAGTASDLQQYESRA